MTADTPVGVEVDQGPLPARSGFFQARVQILYRLGRNISRCMSDCGRRRSEEHTSELQSLMRISYAVFCLKKKTKYNTNYSQLTLTKIAYTPLHIPINYIIL